MLGTFTAITTKAIIGAAAVAVAGAGAVATVSAVGPKVAASQSAVAPGSSNGLPGAFTSLEPTTEATPGATPEATPGATPEATPEVTVDPTVTRDEAIAIAQARYPDLRLYGVEFGIEDGVTVWKVDLRAGGDGARAKVYVDATTGTVVRDRFKDAKAPKPSDDDDDNSGSDDDDDSDDDESEDDENESEDDENESEDD